MKRLFFAILVVCQPSVLRATPRRMRSGPNTPAMDTIAEVPWATLQPGDTVLIHWQADRVQGKMGDLPQGTAALPITIRGVLGPERRTAGDRRQRCDDADEPQLLEREPRHDQDRRANTPADTMPKHIVIENLEIRGAFFGLSIHALQRADADVCRQRRPDLCRKGREPHDSQLHHHRRRQRIVYRLVRRRRRREIFWSRATTSTATATRAAPSSTTITRRRSTSRFSTTVSGRCARGLSRRRSKRPLGRYGRPLQLDRRRQSQSRSRRWRGQRSDPERSGLSTRHLFTATF